MNKNVKATRAYVDGMQNRIKELEIELEALRSAKHVYIVLSEDCNEKDCNCESESIDSVWLDEENAKKQVEKRWRARVSKQKIC